MDMGYNQGKLMYIAGKEDAVEGDVGTLTRPVLGLTIDPTEPDPVPFSYVYTKGSQKSVRVLLVKIRKPPTSGPAKFSVLVPATDCCCGDEWVTRTVDVTLVLPGGKSVVFNPHGLAQFGNTLYLIDFETQLIVIVDADTLETAADGAPLEVRFFDISNDVKISNPRGQAVIALNGNLYALYLDTLDGIKYDPSVLIRLSIGTGGTLTYDTQITVGLNAQAIIPVNDGKADWLLIPAIGGPQDYNGVTNGINSNIWAVPATGTWPGTAKIVVTGNPQVKPATAYDIHAVAAALRDGDSSVYILTQLYDNNSTTALWRVYRTSVGYLLSLTNVPLSMAVAPDDFVVVDEGTVTPRDTYGPYGISFWDLLYEQVPDNDGDEGDRLWAALGTPILVTSGAYGNWIGDPAYGSPTGLYQNAYALFGFLGGVNINMGAFDLTIEATNQAKRGVSLKRGFRRVLTPKPTEEKIEAARAKAAQIKGGKTT
jgi:hypothetical protein